MRSIMIALAVFSFVMTPASAAGARTCGPKSARTVRQSATIRVFSQKQSYFACWRRGRRAPEQLGFDAFGPGESIGPLRLRGRYLAYAYSSCHVTPCSFV